MISTADFAQHTLDQMANDIPHDGAPPKAEFDSEAELEPLPLEVRPFDPVGYRPWTHILPAGGIRHFTDFATDVPEDRLLKEPDSHLLAVAVEGDSRTYRGYGAMTARDWYDELSVGVHDIVDEAGYDLFCSGLTQVIVSRPLLGALVERWWDTTNSLHIFTAREMTMTPYDFAMITSLGVGAI
ncbi:unnamed protein product [Camellia sinensis]